MNHMALTIEDRKSHKREYDKMARPHDVVLFDGKMRSIVSSRGFFFSISSFWSRLLDRANDSSLSIDLPDKQTEKYLDVCFPAAAAAATD